MPRGKAKGPAKRKPEGRTEEQIRGRIHTMKSLASLWGVDVNTLMNRKAADLPRYTKVCGKRLFREDDVDDFMREHMNR